MSETITRIADEDMPKVPQDATPEQVRVWLDEQCGLTPAIAQSLIAPFRGRMATYRAELGNRFGECVLWLAAEGSPTTGAEIAGYASSSPITMRWGAEGLPAVKRTTVAGSPWRVEPDLNSALIETMTNEEVRAYLRKATSTVDRALQVTVELPSGVDYLCVHGVFDLHYGAASQDYLRWENFIEWVMDNQNDRIVLGGDLLNCGNQGKRTAGDRELISPEKAQELLIEDLRPLVPQIVEIRPGNHERRMARDTGVDWDPIMDVAKELGVPYTGYEGFVRWHVTDGERSETYDGYHHHGIGGSGRSDGYAAKKAGDLASVAVCDYSLMGHIHAGRQYGEAVQLCVTPEGFESIRATRHIPVRAWQRARQGTYARSKALRPSTLGATTFRLHLDRHDVTIEEN
jgi:hypothetical protein